MTEVELPVEERLVQLLQHLGIARAHVAARGGGDWGGLAARHPDCIASLTLICPRGMDLSTLATLAPRLLVLAGDQGRPDALVRQAVANLQDGDAHNPARLRQPDDLCRRCRGP